MIQALLYILLGGTAITAVTRPWVGVITAYVFVILGPQYIWWWNFEGLRPFFIIAIPTLIGVIFNIQKGTVKVQILKTKVNLLILTLFLLISVSHFFGPYVDGGPGPQWYEPGVIYDRLWKAYFFYFLAVLSIDDFKKVKWLSFVMVISVIYLIYWANMQYLEGRWYGRLSGPRYHGASLYGDENVFAMLFVVGLPFLFFLGSFFKKTIYKYFTWLIIPFGWHAIFLTGSRGGLLGLAVTIVFIILRSSRKLVGLGLLISLLVCYQWQAGDVMKERAAGLENVEEVDTAETRFQAWEAAFNMMRAYPLTGVGLSAMGPAFPDFSTEKPRVAHSSYFQTGAESGIPALIIYVYLIIWCLYRMVLISIRAKGVLGSDCDDIYVYLLLNSLIVSFAGFSFCGLFLSLNNNEIFLYFLILINFLIYYFENKLELLPSVKESIF